MARKRRKKKTSPTPPPHQPRFRRSLLLVVPAFFGGIAIAIALFSPPSPDAGPLADDPDMRRAEAAFTAGNVNEAIDRYESVRRRHPKRPEPLMGLAKLFIACKQTESALQASEMACTIAPQSAACHVARGQALEAAGERDKARESYQRAATLDPKDPDPPYHLGRLAEAQIHTEVAMRYYRKALAIDPSHGPSAHYLAGQLMDSGQFGEAQRLLTIALKHNPEATGLRFNLAHTYLRQGDAKQAVREFRQGIARVSTMAEPYYHLGCALELLGNDREAVDAYRQALGVDPYLARAWYALAQLLQRGGGAAGAEDAFKRFAEARELLKVIHRLEAYLENNPRNVGALTELGAALLRRGKPFAAYGRLRRALELAPDNQRAKDLLAKVTAAAHTKRSSPVNGPPGR